ncbi:MAG: transcription elongation factor GreA [Candidatus Kerfeldbacteria bacterium]|nr:transcription elongation factor GreA [Candidatus Kerfeldbacteria bacterium]
MTKKTFITKAGLQKIQDELQELKTTKRKEIANRIQEAKELGDLSENAEYIEAKEEQGFVESRIIELEQMLKNTELIAPSKKIQGVQIGSTITITGPGDIKMTYTIVGSSEADPKGNFISNESPLGAAFLGRDAGDDVTVRTPNGEVSYTIVSVE